ALREIHVETSIERASVFRLRFDLSQTQIGDWNVLQFDIFRPLVPVQVRIHMGLGLSETLINGYVREAKLDNRNEPGKSTLEVVGMAATATVMNIHEKPWPWPNVPDSTMADAIFLRYGIIPMSVPTPLTRVINRVTTIQRHTDTRFLMELARR